MTHKPRAALTPWTFGYTPGTKTPCLECEQTLVFFIGAKRQGWRHELPGAQSCDRCGRQWKFEHHCDGRAA